MQCESKLAACADYPLKDAGCVNRMRQGLRQSAERGESSWVSRVVVL